MVLKRLYSEWGNFSSLYGAHFKVPLVDLRFLGIKTNLKNLWTLKKKAILSPKKWVLIWSSGPFYSSGFLRGPHKFDEISKLIWHLLSKIQINWEIYQIFVALLGNLNFKKKQKKQKWLQKGNEMRHMAKKGTKILKLM